MEKEKTTVMISKDLARKFRIRVVERYGGQQGALSRAVAEAITLWLERYKSK